MTNAAHPIVLNSTGGLTFSAAAVPEAAPARVAYVPASAISVAASPTISQPIQLQSFDGGGNGKQWFLLLFGEK